MKPLLKTLMTTTSNYLSIREFYSILKFIHMGLILTSFMTIFFLSNKSVAISLVWLCAVKINSDVFIPLVNSRPQLCQMDLTVQHEASSLAQAEKRGGKAVHCKSSFLMKSAWLQLLLPGRNMLKYSTTVHCLASIKPRSGLRLILLSLYFFILYKNLSIFFLRIQKYFHYQTQ